MVTILSKPTLLSFWHAKYPNHSVNVAVEVTVVVVSVVVAVVDVVRRPDPAAGGHYWPPTQGYFGGGAAPAHLAGAAKECLLTPRKLAAPAFVDDQRCRPFRISPLNPAQIAMTATPIVLFAIPRSQAEFT